MDFAGATEDEVECKANSPQAVMRSVFEFDDEPQEAAKNAVKMRAKTDGDEDVYFVQFPKSPNSNGNGL